MSYYPAREHPYRLFIVKGAAGADKVHFDFFNAAGSGFTIAVSSVRPSMSGAVAVTGVVGLDLFLTHTTAVGTGGTAATREGTSLTASTFGGVATGLSTLPSGITARLAPSGGATAGGVISVVHMFPEETNAAAYTNKDFLQTSSHPDDVLIRQGRGIRVVQGAVASVGNIGFVVEFGLIPR